MAAPATLRRSWKSLGQAWQRISFLFSGAWLAGMVVALVGLRLLWIRLERPAHLDEIAAAFGATSLFHGAPQVSHSGNHFTFVKTSDYGYALYLCDAATGQTRILSHLNNYLGHGGDNFDLQALPWAPDDSSFLCSVSNKLMVCDPDTGQPSAELPIKQNSITELVWLNPAEFAYITNKMSLWRAQKQSDGQWEQHQILTGKNPMSSLTAITADTVAWLEGNLICRVDVTSGTPMTSSLVSSGVSTTRSTKPPNDGLALWLDASTLDTNQPDQSRVTHLRDLSPRKNDALENGNAPLYNSPNSLLTLGGKGTLHFSSGGSVTNVSNATGLATQTAPGISGPEPRSVFVVMRHETPKSSMMVNMGDARARGSLFAVEVNDSYYLPTGWRGADNRIRQTSTNWNLLETVYDGTVQNGYVNGILRGSSGNQLNTADKVVEIGLRTADPTGKNAKVADGDFAELLIYDRALGTDERQQVEDYLSTKWFGHEVRRAAPNPFIWIDPKRTGLTAFSYSKASGTFLLESSVAKQDVLSRYDSNTGESVKIAQDEVLESPQWCDSGDFVYFKRDAKGSRVILADTSGKEKARLLEHSELRWFEILPGGHKLMAFGTISNEPSPGIWECDVESRRIAAVIPYSDYPSKYAREVTPFIKNIKTADGRNLVCEIFRPLNFNPHRKYPLLIGDTVFTDPIYRYQGPCWAPAIANCGGYVVIVERRSWLGGLANWSSDIKTACTTLEQDLRIDSSRIFIFASSAETVYMCQTATNSSTFWNGIILLNPAGNLPDAPRISFFGRQPSVLISSGSHEGKDAEFKAYQLDALQSGTIVHYLVHPDEGHHLIGDAAQLARTKAILDFVLKE